MSRKKTTNDESSEMTLSTRPVSGITSTKSITTLETGEKSLFMSTAPVLRAPKSVSETDQRLARVCKLEDKLLGNKNIESLTINKLRLDSLGMVGREEESKELISCFNRMANAEVHGVKELVFIKGSSGAGKSKVAHTIYNFPTERRTNFTEISKNCIVGEGEFDNDDSDEPFSAVARAFNGLCRTVWAQEESLRDTREKDCDETKVSSLGESLVDDLGPTTEVLVRLMPALRDLLPINKFRHSMGARSSQEQKDDTNFDGAKARTKNAFRFLTRILCKRFHNLVLILDNLQWADVASLEVIDSLISDTQNRNGLMIIGCYRSEAIGKDHLLHHRIQDLHGKKEKQKFTITNIDVLPFSLDEVNEALMRLMAIDEKDVTEPLAKLCLKRTLGNPHFVIEFLTLLTDENLLVFNLGLFRWTWDESKIEKLTMSTENVVELLQGRMKKLPTNEQMLLQYAACLGSSFRIDTLRLVWINHKEKDAQEIAKALEEMIEGLQHGHFIEPDGDSGRQYRWVHHSVQEAALSLERSDVPSFQLEMLQFEIGMILYKELNSQELDQVLFDVVDLINRGQTKRRVDLATLNLKAARKARAMSAFSSALVYTSHGIRLLPGDRWAPEQSALTLELYTLGSQMAQATGDFARLEEYSEEVVSQSGCTLLEKIPVYIAQITNLLANMKHNEVKGISLKLLKDLGCNLVPWPALLPVQAYASLKRTAQQAKRICSNQFCEKHPSMEDAHECATVELLSLLGYASIFNGDFFILVLCTTKAVQMTLRHGIHDFSAAFFVNLAVLSKKVFGDFDSASSFAEISQLLQQRIQDQFYASVAVFEVYIHVLCWTTPLQSCFVPILENYTRALRGGNNEIAMWSLMIYHTSMPYQLGKPLGPMLAGLEEILNQTDEMNLKEHSLIVRMSWQAFYNLSGKSDEPMKLKGDIVDCDKEEMGNPFQSVTAKRFKIDLHLIYGDHEGAAKLAIEQGDNYGKVINDEFLTMMETFHRAVSCYAAFHKTKHRKYKREAKRIRRKINGWKKKKLPNVLHHALLLDAEQAAVEKKYAKAEGLYKEAVTMAARPGNLLHAALISERYADFLKRNSHHLVAAEEEIRFRINEAIRYYTEWGALLKVEMMKKDWARYCGSSVRGYIHESSSMLCLS